MDPKRFLFVSADAAPITDPAWPVLREGHDVKHYIEAERDRARMKRPGRWRNPFGRRGESGRRGTATFRAPVTFYRVGVGTSCMAKYSTGGGGGDGDGDACELCGRETTNLQRANVAGARLLVCSDCRPHDDAGRQSGGGGGGHGGTGSRGGAGGSGSGRGGGSGSGGANRNDSGNGPSSRTQEIANKQARVYDAATGDSAHWEAEGTDYEDDRLPYLVSGYGDSAREARQDAGLTVEELADELDVDEDHVLAVEQGRAATANIGGSVVRAIGDRLDVDLVDE